MLLPDEIETVTDIFPLYRPATNMLIGLWRKDSGVLEYRDSLSAVRNVDFHIQLPAFNGNPDRTALRRVLHGVVQNIEQGLLPSGENADCQPPDGKRHPVGAVRAGEQAAGVFTGIQRAVGQARR